MTSENDVIMSDFHQIFRKCSSYGYGTSDQKLGHLGHFRQNYGYFCVFGYNMGFPIHFLPQFNKTAILQNFFIIYVVWVNYKYTGWAKKGLPRKFE